MARGISNAYIHKGRPFSSGEVWGQSEGPEGFSYSNLNGNSFGYGALQGGSNTYSNGNKSVSVSRVNMNPYMVKAYHHHDTATVGSCLSCKK